MATKLTITSITNILSSIAGNHPLLQGRFKFNMPRNWQPDFEKWPILYADTRQSDTIKNENIFRDIISVEIMILDLDSRDQLSTNDIISDTRELLLDIFSLFRNALAGTSSRIDSISGADLVYMAGIDGLTGWRLTMQIDAGAISACGIAGNDSIPPTPFCAPAKIVFSSGKPVEYAPSGSTYLVNDEGGSCPDLNELVSASSTNDIINATNLAGKTIPVIAAATAVQVNDAYDTMPASKQSDIHDHIAELREWIITGNDNTSAPLTFESDSVLLDYSVRTIDTINAKNIIISVDGIAQTLPFDLNKGQKFTLSFDKINPVTNASVTITAWFKDKITTGVASVEQAMTSVTLNRFVTPATSDVRAIINTMYSRALNDVPGVDLIGDYLDCLYFFTLAEKQQCSINFARNAYDCNIFGGIDHSAFAYLKGNGVDGYLNTNFNANITGSKYQKDDAMLWVKSTSNINYGNVWIGNSGVDAGAAYKYPTSSNIVSFINGNTNPINASSGGGEGSFATIRESSSTIKLYKNDTLISTQSAATSAASMPGDNFTIFALNNYATGGIPGYFYSGELEFVAIGKNPGANRSALYDIIIDTINNLKSLL